MRCPNDSNELIKTRYEASIEVDQCPACQGMWLDQGELEAIQETRDHDYSAELNALPNVVAQSYRLAQARHEATYRCPQCDADMSKREYGYGSQVMIDVCPSCRGIWLHQNEIQELEVFFERSQAETRSLRDGFLLSLVSLFRRG